MNLNIAKKHNKIGHKSMSRFFVSSAAAAMFLFMFADINSAAAKNFTIFNAADSNQPYFTVNGTSGNVGIGTTGPGTLLHLLSPTTSNSGLKIEGLSHSVTLSIVANEAFLNPSYRMYIQNAGSSVFFTNGGAAAIGGSVPSLPRGVYITPLAAGFKGMVLQGVSGQTANLFEWQSSTGAGLGAIDSSGDVAIGTTTAGTTLDVGGAIGSFRAKSATFSNIGSGLIMSDASGNLYSTSSVAATGIPSPSGLTGQTLRSNGTNWIANNLLYNNGTNVGIGTTAPATKLHVYGTNDLRVVGTSGDSILRLTNQYTANYGSGSEIQFGFSADTAGTKALSVIKGLYTINTGPNYGGDLAFYTRTAADGSLNERLRINSVGNVGIATTNPLYKFDVAGTGHVSNTLYLDTPSAAQNGVNLQNLTITSDPYTSQMIFGYDYDALVNADKRYAVTLGGGFSGTSANLFDGNTGSALYSTAGSTGTIEVDLGGMQHYFYGLVLTSPWGTGYGFSSSFLIEKYYDTHNGAGGWDNNCDNSEGGMAWGTVADVTGFSGRQYVTRSGLGNGICKLRVTFRDVVGTQNQIQVGDLSMYQFYYGYKGLNARTNGDTLFGDYDFSDGTTRVHIDNSTGSSYFNGGSVGIGVTNPGATLDVGGTIGSFRAKSGTLSNIGAGLIMADASGNLYSTSSAVATGIPSPSGISGQTLRSNGTNWITNNLLYNNGTNVGVGTSSPVSKLDVAGNIKGQQMVLDNIVGGNYNEGIRINGGAGTWRGIFLGGALNSTSGTDANLWSVLRDNSNNFRITNNVSSNAVIFANTSGNVGINTTTPVAKFAIQGNGSDILNIFDSAGAEKFTVLSNGNVGVGTTTPSYQFQVGANAGGYSSIGLDASTIFPKVYFGTLGSYIGYDHNSSERMVLNSRYVNSHYEFQIAGSEKVRIDNTGNVGIGVTTTGATLDVGGATGSFRAKSGTLSNIGSGIIMADGSGNLYSTSSLAAITAGWTVNGNDVYKTSLTGNVGIGITNPGNILQVNQTSLTPGIKIRSEYASPAATMIFSSNVGTVDWYVGKNILGTAAGDSLSFSTSAYTAGVKMLIDSAGNVGIGTTNPTGKLEVNGDLKSITAQIGAGQISSKTWSGSVASPAGDGTTNLVAAFTAADPISYRVRVFIVSDTSTQTGATFLIRNNKAYNTDANNWTAKLVSRSGSTSNNVNLDVNAVSGVVSVSHFHTSSPYTVGYLVEEIQTANQNSFDMFGADNTWTRDTGRLFYTEGNVGIGTTTSGTTLDVGGATGSFRAKSGTLSNIGSGIIMADASGNLYSTSSLAAITAGWTVNGTTVYKTDVNGNVGIGTTNPGGKLTINSYTGAATDGPQGTYGQVSIFSDVGSSALFLGAKNSAYANRGYGFTVTQSGVNTDLNILEYGFPGTRMTIKSGGNVGIGTTSPVGLLHVAASAAPTADMVNISNAGFPVATAGVSGLQIGYTGGAGAIEASAQRTDLTPGSTSGSTWNALRVTSGAAGAGVTLNGIKLEDKTAGAGTSVGLRIGTGWDYGIYSNTAGINYFAGNVGIGTTAPTGKLHIYGNTASSDLKFGLPTWTEYGRIDYSGTTDILSIESFGATASYGQIAFSTGNPLAERMRITNLGNVGIGTTSTGATLDVGGATGSFRAKSGTLSNIGSGIIMADGSGNLYSTSSLAAISAGWTVNGTTVYKTDVNGNVGVGTTNPTAAKLEVALSDNNTSYLGTAGQYALRISNTNATDNNWAQLIFGASGANATWIGTQFVSQASGYGDLVFGTRGSSNLGERMRITSTGNVGIGITNPGTYKLNVNGTSYFNDTVALRTWYNKTLKSYLRADDSESFINIDDNMTTAEVAEALGSSVTTGMTKVDDPTAPAPGAFEVSGPKNIGPDATTPYWKVDDTSEYIFETWIKVVSSTATPQRFYAGWEMYDSAKTSFGNNQRYWGSGGTEYDTDSYNDGAWHHIVARISGVGAGSGNFIAGTEYARLVLLFNYNSGDTVTRYAGMKLYKSKKIFTSIYAKNGGQASVDSDGKLIIDYNGNVSPNNLQASGAGPHYFSAGNVGIGTTTPGATLDIMGAVASLRAKSATLSNIGAGLIMADATGNLYSTTSAAATGIPSPAGLTGQTLRSNGTNWVANSLLYVNGTNVGVGTTSPISKLDVQGGDLNVGGQGRFKGWYTQGTGRAVEVGISAGVGFIYNYDRTASTYGDLDFNNAIHIVGSAGNVGIGTTSPIAKLQLNGNWVPNPGGTNTVYLSNSGFANVTVSPQQIITSDSASLSPGAVIGLDLHNNNTTTGAFAPLLVFSKRESGASAYNSSIAAIGARTVTGSGTGDSWIDGELMFYTAPTVGSGLLERMRIDQSGNVGIGATNPQARLMITGTSGYGMLKLSPSVADGERTIGFFRDVAGTETATAWVAGVGGWGNTNKFTIGYNSAPDLIIDTIGNVGIGATSTGATLDVGGTTGSFRAKSGTLSNIGTGIIMADASGNLYSTSSLAAISAGWTVNGTTVYKTDTSGNVGIGTNAPGFKLHVTGSTFSNKFTTLSGFNTPTTTALYINDINGQLAAGESLAIIRGFNYSNDDNANLLTVGTAGGSGWERFVIKSSGNVGIGTTTPNAKLRVEGNIILNGSAAGTTSYLQVKNNGTDFMYFGSDSGATAGSASDANLYVYGNNKLFLSTNNSKRLTVDGNGNVGIGTTNPSSIFDVSAGTPILTLSSSINTAFHGIEFKNSGNLDASIKQHPSTGELRIGVGRSVGWGGTQTFYTDTAERMRITSGGNIGIGTSTPAVKFHVYGNGTYAAAFMNGFVGIGVTNPGTTLDIGGTIGSFRAKSGTLSNIGAGLVMADATGNLYSTSTTAATGIPSPGGINGQTLRSDGTDWVANSLLYNNGTNIGIGTTTPGAKLNVIGGNLWIGTTNATGQASSTLSVNGGSGLGTVNGVMALRRNDAPSNTNTIGYLASFQRINSDVAAWYMGSDTSMNAVLASNNSQLRIGRDLNGTFTEQLRIDNFGNVGIGTTSPAYKLDISGAGYASLGFVTANNQGYAAQRSGGTVQDMFMIDSSDKIQIGSTGFANDINFRSNAGSLMTILGSGNVGVGTTNPGASLDVADTIGSFRAKSGTLSNIGAGLVMADSAGNLFSTTSPSFAGGSMTGDLNMNGFDILNVDKLNVNTIDPLYNIRGTKYSTYAASIAGGVKEEYVGKITVNTLGANKEYEKVIDFANEPEGTDLWVWRQVIDFNSENVEVLITPYGRFANAYYLIKNNQLIFRSDKPVTLSYRLIGRRFDWRSWPTKAMDQTQSGGLEIK